MPDDVRVPYRPEVRLEVSREKPRGFTAGNTSGLSAPELEALNRALGRLMASGLSEAAAKVALDVAVLGQQHRDGKLNPVGARFGARAFRDTGCIKASASPSKPENLELRGRLPGARKLVPVVLNGDETNVETNADRCQVIRGP